jgi:YidC/Oxa1 family membrane protein insertase
MYTWVQPVISFLSDILVHVYAFTHDWGIAVMVLTVAVKIALYRFNLAAARNQARTAAAGPELRQIRDDHPNDPQRQLAETAKVYRKFGVNPLAATLALLVQMPMLAAMYGLFLTHGQFMTSALLPWMLDLAHADPLHLLPLASGAITALTGLIPPILPRAGLEAGTAKRLFTALALMSIPIAVTWRSPAALGLYWLTGSVFQLLERLFYRTPYGKRMLYRGLPKELMSAVR